MRNLFVLASLLTAWSGSLCASTITIDAEVLKDADGTPMPLTGLIILTAGSTGTFTGPTEGSFASGSEIIVSKWDLSGGFATPGIFSDIASNVMASGAWGQGDSLRLYWYPTLTIDSTAPAAGTQYGTYTDSVGVNGSAPWVTPGPSDTVSLKFLTSDASFLAPGGSNPSSAGQASLQVVPEPGSAILGLWAAGMFGLLRRRRLSSAR